MCIEINAYTDSRGRVPYQDWLVKIKDEYFRTRITSYVDRLEFGVFGDSRPIGSGISELRIHCGPGYRVYYAKTGRKAYLLLCGGDKSSQKNDIELAKQYLRIFKKREVFFI